MKIDRVGYGATINTGDYENIKLYLEAEIEPWENPVESIKLLSQKVIEYSEKKSQADDYETLAQKAERRVSDANWKLKRAEVAWDKITKARDEILSILVACGASEEKVSALKSDFPSKPYFDLVKIVTDEVDEQENDDEYGDNEQLEY